MDEHKICFISCVNNPTQYNRAIQYMKMLKVPEGFRTEFVQITDAASLTSGYNRAMRMTDAKYKVYLHQDVYILYPNFLLETIRLFQDHPELGALGMAGAERLPPHGVWYEGAHRYGKVYGLNRNGLFTVNFLEVEGAYRKALVVDGLLIMTQYDLPWQEEIFDGWHFYDVTQCIEFRKAGYEVGVLGQSLPWCIHDCVLDFEGYEHYRQLFMKHYGEWVDRPGAAPAERKTGAPEPRPVKENKVCFITCVNDPPLYERARQYMNLLKIPDGFEVEFLPIAGAPSMTAGYNRGMAQSDAKYKIYLHQDVFILYPNLLVDTLRLFAKHPRLGLIGLIGIGAPLPADAVWVKSPNSYGKLYGLRERPEDGLMLIQFKHFLGEYQPVRVVDGMLMATQYDIPWREDLFTGWHFYDTSQSMEFAKAGLEVGVIRQDAPWTLHACDVNEMIGYEEARQIFVREYGSWITRP